MDVFESVLQSGVLTAIVLICGIVLKKITGNHRTDSDGWKYPITFLGSRFAVNRWKKKLREDEFYTAIDQAPRTYLENGTDSWTLRASAIDGTSLFLVIRKLCRVQPLAEIVVHVQLPNGTSYKLPRHPDTVVGTWDCEEGEWKAGDLRIQALETWKRLRVLYNGMLINTDTKAVHHVRLNLIWTCASSVVSHPEDWNTTLAIEPWRNGQLHKLLENWREGGNQTWGCVQGWLQVYNASGVPDVKTWLQARGVSERVWTSHEHHHLRQSISVMVIAKDGTAVHLRAHSYNNVLTDIFSGTVRTPNTTVDTIKSTDFSISEFRKTEGYFLTRYTINIVSSARKIKLVLDIGNNGGRILSGVPYQQETIYKTVVGEIDGIVASGILELSTATYDFGEPSVKLAAPRTLCWLSPKDISDVSYCAAFDSPAATCPQLVGGKGASLALLASVQQTQGYKVPPGFCLTTKALEKHLEENPELKNAIEEIKLATISYEESNFKQKCDRTVLLFKNTTIKGNLRDIIIQYITNLRDNGSRQNSDEIRFAVRSSAVGEDSEALSAAGQNDTVLGCASDADVLRAVLKCWGSMFTFTSAHYRRQNGQPCMTGAGVVVQVLVPPRAAGVLFTRHPQAGDPSRILITANYGLGESVVSGTVEPDTVVLSRGLDDKLSIASVELGSKKMLITTDESEITAKEVAEKDRGISCLSDDESIYLGRLAIAQEHLWGAPRDIEWAINKDGVYLLQARPITSLEMWTEEELLHEMDDPIMSDDELLSTANTGEVMPKPMTPLSQNIVIKTLNKSMMEFLKQKCGPYDYTFYITHNRCLINLYNTLYRKMLPKLDIVVQMMEMASHGHLVADERILGIAIHRRPTARIDKIFELWLILKSLLTAKRFVNNAKKAVKEISFNKTNFNKLDGLLNELVDGSAEQLSEASTAHFVTTAASSAVNTIAMTLLLGRAEEFTNEHCNDLAKMLSYSDTVSAEVPVALSAISQKLKCSGKIEEFILLPPQEGMHWIKNNLPDLHKEVEIFLTKHGHRAVMEYDLATTPWAIDPKGFIAALQSVQMTKSNNKDIIANKSDKDIIASLVTPTKYITRQILRWMLPLCRKMVRRREDTKAQLCLGIHKIRLAIRKLGKAMEQEWLLPNVELVFYFTLEELKVYIKTRDPTLIKKAIQRQQYYTKWGKIKLSELNEGWPKPKEVKRETLASAGTKIKATPICGGELIARACVIHDLSEIKQLQHGDILITHCTDIGWSPYFPLLTGIVTELGGLISHGAVIARECGLPCVVGAAGATDEFKTGDFIRINGTTGVVDKVNECDLDTNEDRKIN